MLVTAIALTVLYIAITITGLYDTMWDWTVPLVTLFFGIIIGGATAYLSYLSLSLGGPFIVLLWVSFIGAVIISRKKRSQILSQRTDPMTKDEVRDFYVDTSSMLYFFWIFELIMKIIPKPKDRTEKINGKITSRKPL